LVLQLVGCQREAALPALPPDAVILAFGDSLTEGTGARADKSYPAVLEALTGRRVVNAGKRGEESDAGLARLPGVMAEIKPQLVILEHGGNDILRHRDLHRTEENLRQMVLLVRQDGASVVLVGIPSLGFFLGTHPLYEHLAESLNVPLEGDALADILGKGDLKSDFIHPNAAGYRALAEAICRLLVERGALRNCLETLGSSQSVGHELDHRQINSGLAGGHQPLIIVAEAMGVVEPRKGALDHPTTGQQDERAALLGTQNNRNGPTGHTWTAEEMKPAYVADGSGRYLVRLPADNRWGFVLADGNQTWPGGFGSGLHRWHPVPPDQVPASERDRLGWLLDGGD
jgi:acyl-CoA thioesterase-1